MILIENAELKNDYEVFIKFNDGHSGIVDFKNLLENDHRKIIRSLLDKEMFQTMRIDLDTICWDNSIYFAPEYLYEKTGK